MPGQARARHSLERGLAGGFGRSRSGFGAFGVDGIGVAMVAELLDGGADGNGRYNGDGDQSGLGLKSALAPGSAHFLKIRPLSFSGSCFKIFNFCSQDLLLVGENQPDVGFVFQDWQ